MAISFVDANYTESSFDVTVPAGIVENDFLVALSVHDGTSLAGPAGWTEQIEFPWGGELGGPDDVFRFYMHYKLANASEGSSFTFTQTAGEETMCWVGAYTGTHETSPLSSNTFGYFESNLASLLPATVHYDNSWAIWCLGLGDNPESRGFVETIADAVSGASVRVNEVYTTSDMQVGDKSLGTGVSQTPTGSVGLTLPSSSKGISVTIVIRPAEAGGGGGGGGGAAYTRRIDGGLCDSSLVGTGLAK